MNADSGRIEVSDILEEYDPDNFGEFDFGQFRIIILERWLPEKEFTEYDRWRTRVRKKEQYHHRCMCPRSKRKRTFRR